jgi:phosphatidate phosphatase APP1
MAALYQGWATNTGAQFHYVSASPWQLYVPLAAFMHSNGFPAGSFHLKSFRPKDRSFFELFASPVEYKLSVIEPLLKRFPKRQFVLVGDSGEKDPEVYARLAREHPEQIVMILIRELSDEGPESTRYRTVFQKLPSEKWRLFRDPKEIADSLKLSAP